MRGQGRRAHIRSDSDGSRHDGGIRGEAQQNRESERREQEGKRSRQVNVQDPVEAEGITSRAPWSWEGLTKKEMARVFGNLFSEKPKSGGQEERFRCVQQRVSLVVVVGGYVMVRSGEECGGGRRGDVAPPHLHVRG